MNNGEAMNVLRIIASGIELKGYSDRWVSSFREAYELAIKALERDAKVDYITEHWNDMRCNFVAGCEAFEDILKVYGRGISEEAENENIN